MRFQGTSSALGLLVALIALIALPTKSANAARPGEGSGKGTIGMVCVNPAGEYFFWDQDTQDSKEEYASCIDEVVSNWVAEESAADSIPAPLSKKRAFEDWVGGMDTYREAVARLRPMPKPDATTGAGPFCGPDRPSAPNRVNSSNKETK
jgi:hypothetical protein